MDNGVSSYRRFLNGDENGFVEIVRDYKDGLILYLAGIVHDLSTAEDLAEETFVKLGIKKPRFAETASFKTWLYTIGRNLAIDCIRKRAREKTVSLDSCAELRQEESSGDLLLQEERKRMIRKAMYNLKEEYRQVLWLSYFEGFTNKEIAKILKKSTHSVETLTYRARQALKSELIREGFCDEDI